MLSDASSKEPQRGAQEVSKETTFGGNLAQCLAHMSCSTSPSFPPLPPLFLTNTSASGGGEGGGLRWWTQSSEEMRGNSRFSFQSTVPGLVTYSVKPWVPRAVPLFQGWVKAWFTRTGLMHRHLQGRNSHLLRFWPEMQILTRCRFQLS